MPGHQVRWLWALLVFAGGLAGRSAGAEISAGRLDLSRVDLSQAEPIALDGDWAFYWQRLLRPGEPAPESVVPTVLFRLPQTWNGREAGGVRLSARGYATYRLRITLPPHPPPLALKVEDVYTAFEVWAGDELVARNGRVGTTAATTEPQWLPQTVRLPTPADGELELTLLVANFDHHRGGSTQSLMLGTHARLSELHAQALMRDMFLTGCLVMGGLFFLGLYAFGSHDRAVLYFSLFCLAYGYRIGGTQLYALHALWPGLPWWFTVRAEFLSLFLGVFFFSRHLRLLYPLDTHRRALGLLDGIALTAAAATVTLPPFWFTALARPFVALLLPYLVYAVAVYVQAARRQRPGAIWGVLSMAVLAAAVGAGSITYLTGRPAPVLLAFSGYLGFFFFQSLIHSFRFAHTLREAKENAEHSARAKTDFLSMISHEIRTPLNGVVGLTNVLLQENPRGDQREWLDALKFSAHHLLGIINRLLDFNKIEAGRMELELRETDLAALARHIHAALQPTADAKQLTFTLTVDPALPPVVMGDAVRMSQVLTNLLDNALKFTSAGSVALSLTTVARSERAVAVAFEVRDTGIGIPADQLGRIFEDFSQANPSTTRLFGGTGLGLAICKRLLALQDVELQVASEPGRGTRFFFTQTFPLPALHASTPADAAGAADPAAGTTATATGEAAPWAGGRRVLLVEDNPVNTTVARRLLARWNLEVDHAPNGEAALHCLAGRPYDLVLMDLQMPVMDGFAATREIRRRGHRLPIVALTATTVDDTAAQVRAAGMDGLVTKPFSPARLRAELARHLPPAGTASPVPPA